MRILIATNHSYMFYRFRKELVEALMQEHEVILSTPFVGHEDDLQAMGLRCIRTNRAGQSIETTKNSRLRGTAVSDLFFFVYFCFLALVQVFYSRATPIIMP